jgi:hypothetical protein
MSQRPTPRLFGGLQERGLAGLRLMQSARETPRVTPRGGCGPGRLAVIRDRLMTIPDRMSTLTAVQRQALRQELTDALEAWSKTET